MTTPKTFDELVELRARVIYDIDLRWRNSDHYDFHEAPDWIRERCLKIARATIIAEIEAGILAVPAEQFAHMIHTLRQHHNLGLDNDGYGDSTLCHDTLKAIAAGALRPEEE